MHNVSKETVCKGGEGNRYEDNNVDRRKAPTDPEQKKLDRELDQALEETFPASDPVQLTNKSRDR